VARLSTLCPAGKGWSVPAGRAAGVCTPCCGPHAGKKTAEGLGEEFKISENTIRSDGRLAKALDWIVFNCGAEVRNLLLARHMGVTRGTIMRLSKLPAEQQHRFIEELRSGGKRPRKPYTHKQKQTITLPRRPKALVQALLEHLEPADLAEVARALSAALDQQGQRSTPAQTEKRSGKRGGKTSR
jgi:hypothetical protein